MVERKLRLQAWGWLSAQLFALAVYARFGVVLTRDSPWQVARARGVQSCSAVLAIVV